MERLREGKRSQRYQRKILMSFYIARHRVFLDDG
jgi:hypothetical protein